MEEAKSQSTPRRISPKCRPVAVGQEGKEIRQKPAPAHSNARKGRTGRVRDQESNDALGVDNEDRSDGEGDALGVDVGLVERVEHVVQGGDLFKAKPTRSGHHTSTETSKGGTKEREPTFLSWSPMIGKPTLACEISSMSLTQSLCDEMSSADRPMTFNQTANEGHGPCKPPVSKPAKRRDEESKDEGPG